MAIDEKKLIEGCKKYLEDTYTFQTPLEYSVAMTRLLKIIEAQPKISLENKTSDKWIPCSERLPEVNKKVLVTYERLNRKSLQIGFDKRVICKAGERWQGKGTSIIAWMPLPPAYKGE